MVKVDRRSGCRSAGVVTTVTFSEPWLLSTFNLTCVFPTGHHARHLGQVAFSPHRAVHRRRDVGHGVAVVLVRRMSDTA